MINSIFILNTNGEVIIEKHYRGNVRRGECDLFWAEVLKAESPDDLLPVISTSSGVLIHILRSSLYFVASVKTDVMPIVVVEFLQRIADIFVDYFDELNEHALKDHFITVYELLDDMMDHGYPFTCEPNILKELIVPPSMINKMIGVFDIVTGETGIRAQLPAGTNSISPWRRSGVKYLQQEVFVDIIEEVDGYARAGMGVMEMQVTGTVLLNCRLSGTPNLVLMLNEMKDSLDDVALHPCVRIFRYEQEGIISFIPPDGSFKLMNYIIRKHYPLPVYLHARVNYDAGSHSGKVAVSMASRSFGSVGGDGTIEDCVITIPLSTETLSASLSCSLGNAHFDSAKKLCKWTVGTIPKGKTCNLTGNLSLDPKLPTPKDSSSVLVQCTVMGYIASGLSVASLHVNGETSQPYRGLRCTTKLRRMEFLT
mmetsp:Transcript_3574/g.10768  ORF Transcript_3574/g.10768 Transcript_3574/m.10768 type:complete len:425 (-) Transcript_3574:2141-3415(-)|eukprot:CAMPEP_0198728858 /NCGR_PEP_ID=MMETSP1475-20131203/11874_1 /TAXON_ID= ORGANISM="Unidentified sp., Strain CCMP1999" /NCGR_SAMPLE_ID=MMETSP1475 /ASSEMBLY_ACC=CAM_ASM_001111 /LENGTH=424 /DNA_ID=CAMNT_0044491329 /DNA_START=41 /DNA_END=1315 /DNA_ORIENTATION=+